MQYAARGLVGKVRYGSRSFYTQFQISAEHGIATVLNAELRLMPHLRGYAPQIAHQADKMAHEDNSSFI